MIAAMLYNFERETATECGSSTKCVRERLSSDVNCPNPSSKYDCIVFITQLL